MSRTAFAILLFTSVTFGAMAQPRVWTLSECISHAIENNIDIRHQALRADYYENLLIMSRMSRLPTLEGRASHNYSFGRVLDETTYEFIEQQTVRSNRFHAGSSLTLYGGMQISNNIVRSGHQLTASRYDLKQIKESIVLSVTMAYLEIVLTRELIAITGNQIEMTAQQVERASRLVDAGTLAHGALLEIEAQAAAEQLHLTNLKSRLDLSILTLTQMMELDSPDGFEIAPPEGRSMPPPSETGGFDDLYHTALATQPSILAAEARVNIAGSDLKIARGARHPSLTLRTAFSTGYSDARLMPLGTDPITGPQYGEYPFADQLSDNINYGLGFTLSLPVLNGWRTRTEINNRQIMLQSSEYELEAARKELYKELQQVSAAARAALNRYNAGLKAVEAAQKALHYAEERLGVGAVTMLDYNRSKTELLKRESELLQARYEYIFKTKVLDHYRGIPIEL